MYFDGQYESCSLFPESLRMLLDQLSGKKDKGTKCGNYKCSSVYIFQKKKS